MSDGEAWWKEATVYQVYPSSFADGNGDGLGDVKGMTSKLDYLKSLGVDVLWTSPIYDSPQKDMGYDISDYRALYAPYGNLEDWDELKDGLHKRGMKLMMDLVVNHTSDEHEWFVESRSSKSSPKRDWYIWRPARIGENGERLPPNNWASVFGDESAWAWDEQTEEYYLRLFVKEQPDLNWENPELRQAVYDLMKFWLDRGADGFRMDVINLISKVPGHPDASVLRPGKFVQPPFAHTANGPRVHEFLQEMHREVLSNYDTITVGETPFTHDIPTLIEYSRPENKELQMVFTFELHDLDSAGVNDSMAVRSYNLTEFKKVIEKYQLGLYNGGWNSLYLGNHDQARSVSRWANDSPEFRAISAKTLATLHNTLCGTTYVYQGEEIGMKNVPNNWTIDQFPDVATQMYYQAVLEDRRKAQGVASPDMEDVMASIRRKARDNARTPIPWNGEANGGFSKSKPWMDLMPDYTEGWNVAAQEADPSSVLSYWKEMIRVRKANKVLIYGDFKILDFDNESTFAYLRSWKGEKALVLLSFDTKATDFELPSDLGNLAAAKWLIGNYKEQPLEQKVHLLPYESRVYLLA